MVAPPSFFIAQQETSVLPQLLQICTNVFLAVLPKPSVLMEVSQVGHKCLFTVLTYSGFAPLEGWGTTVT